MYYCNVFLKSWWKKIIQPGIDWPELRKGNCERLCRTLNSSEYMIASFLLSSFPSFINLFLPELNTILSFIAFKTTMWQEHFDLTLNLHSGHSVGVVSLSWGTPPRQQVWDTRAHSWPTDSVWSQGRPCSWAVFPRRQQSQHICRTHMNKSCVSAAEPTVWQMVQQHWISQTDTYWLSSFLRDNVINHEYMGVLKSWKKAKKVMIVSRLLSDIAGHLKLRAQKIINGDDKWRFKQIAKCA